MHRCLLLANKEIARGWHLLNWRRRSYHAAWQFVHLRTGSSTDPAAAAGEHPLCRSGGGQDPAADPISGSGTALAAGKAGEELDLLGPFGRGFLLDETARRFLWPAASGWLHSFCGVRGETHLPFEFSWGQSDASCRRMSIFWPMELRRSLLLKMVRAAAGIGTALLEERLAGAVKPLRVHARAAPMLAGWRSWPLRRGAGFTYPWNRGWPAA